MADGTRREVNEKTREELNAKIEALTVARHQGELVTSGRFTFGEWLDQWLRDHVKPNLAITTYERYRGIANNRIKPKLGRLRLDQLDTPHVQRFYRQLHDDGLARPTIDLIHSVLHHSLDDARRLRLVGRNVAADARRIGARRDRDATDRAFTEEQLQVLDRALAGHRHEWSWRTMLLTGLRSAKMLRDRSTDCRTNVGYGCAHARTHARTCRANGTSSKCRSYELCRRRLNSRTTNTGGCVGYIAYSYAIYAFSPHFNSLFLVYVAT
jgi:Phage integrase, N-terminal SAM-like domain